MGSRRADNSVLVLISGGVDSAVAVMSLLEQGYHVETLFLKLFDSSESDASCSAAKRLSGKFGVPFHELDYSHRFKREIIDYFIKSYKKGLTPNPCVRCNPAIKIAAGIELIKKTGLSRLATGHYCRIETQEQGTMLCRGLDTGKDQSYFLHGVSKEFLPQLLFPLGTMLKSDVREKAASAGIRNLVQKESQDVCFLPGDYRQFLEKQGVSFSGSGPMVDMSGNIVGSHRGLHNYTVGQRRGLGLPGPEPSYVIRLDMENNRLVVGHESCLYSSFACLKRVNWLVLPEHIDSSSAEDGVLTFYCDVKIRYRHRAVPAEVTVSGSDVRVNFHEPQRAVTPGQFAVFYQGDVVIGGGEICA